jgi:G3E family GTPase
MLFCQVLKLKQTKRNKKPFFSLLKRDAGVQAIEQLLEKRRNQFDYILLETTGVADPLPIVKMFWLDEELHSDLILDGREK